MPQKDSRIAPDLGVGVWVPSVLIVAASAVVCNTMGLGWGIFV